MDNEAFKRRLEGMMGSQIRGLPPMLPPKNTRVTLEEAAEEAKLPSPIYDEVIDELMTRFGERRRNSMNSDMSSSGMRMSNEDVKQSWKEWFGRLYSNMLDFAMMVSMGLPVDTAMQGTKGMAGTCGGQSCNFRDSTQV